MLEVLYKAFGDKAYDDDKKADKVGMVRLVYAALHTITCFAIIANCIRQW